MPAYEASNRLGRSWVDDELRDLTEFAALNHLWSLRNSSELIQVYSSACEALTYERRAVERFLDEGGHAYGFSSYVGHMDSRDRVPGLDGELLKSHDIGLLSPIDIDESFAIRLVKVHQLACGGSGISTSAFDELLRKDSRSLERVELDLDASYGCGDVSIASSWVRQIFGDSFREAGDVIALINGQFISSALALAVRPKMHFLVDRVIDLLDRLRKLQSHWSGNSTQTSVSLRDLEPLYGQVSRALIDFDVALWRSIDRGAFNPRFEFIGEGSGMSARPVSNSSFMNFELADALSKVLRMFAVVGSYVSGAIHTCCYLAEKRWDQVNDLFFLLQPPKVATSYCNILELKSSIVPRVSVNESYGIEDVCDGSLALVNVVKSSVSVGLKLVRLGENTYDLLNSHDNPVDTGLL